MSELPISANNAEDSTFQIAWASLADLSYQKNWISSADGKEVTDVHLEHIEVRKSFLVLPRFHQRLHGSHRRDRVVKDMEQRFAQAKHDVFRSAMMKSSAIMAVLTIFAAVLALVQDLWLRAAIFLGLIFPLYTSYSVCASRRTLWKRLGRCRVVLLLLLCIQSVAIALAEWDRPFKTWGTLLVHTTFVSNFSPFGVMEIFFATAICGVPTYIIVSFYPDWKVNLTQPGGCNEQPGDAAGFLPELVLPPVVCICQLVLAIWRDETMRLDFLLRDQLQAQRKKLNVENEKSEDLLKSILPQAIIDSLKRHEPIECQDFQNVTVIFVQVCDFAQMCSVLPPTTIVQLLDKVFQELDRLSDLLKVHKVETVGDVYMAVSGCPHEIANHADVAAHFAIAAQSSILRMRASDVILPQGVKGRRLSVVLGEKQMELKIRIGLNSGRIRAGVVGLDKPRYKLFGDTVNTASRMESTSEPGCTQISESTKTNLSEEFHAEERGWVEVKGKGALRTYYLRGYNLLETVDDSKAQDSMTIKVIQKASLGVLEQEKYDYHTEAPGNPLLRRAAGKALQDLLDSVPHNEAISRGQSTKDTKGMSFERSRWRDWLDMKLLLVSSTSKRPEMLLSLQADKPEYKRVTLDRRIFFSRGLVIAWHLVLACTALLDYAFDIPLSDWGRYRFGMLVRTWGVQVTGWLHLGLLMDKSAFDRRGKLITVVMLVLEGVAVALLDAMIFNNDPFFFMLYGLYVLLSKSATFPARMLLCFLALVGWLVTDSMLCDWQLRRRKLQHIIHTAVVLLLTAAGIRMQEHLDHCASYYERHVQRRIDSISDFKGSNQKLLAKILPSHVVQLVSDGVSPIAEDYADVSVVFTDLQGFTAFSSRISPKELVELLNMLYSAFDETIWDWGLHKVEVIGDAYFISSGCPIEDATLGPDQYAMRAVEVALALQRIVPSVCDDGSVQMRCGIHTGNVVAGVVGKKGPRFHLFGPNVEYANRMESTGLPGKVQISFATKQWLDIGGHDYIFEDRSVDMGGRHDRTFLVTRSKARAAKKIRTALAMQRHEQVVAAAATEPSEGV